MDTDFFTMVLAHITLHMLNACCMRMRRHRQVFFCSQSQPNRCSQSTSSISTMYCDPNHTAKAATRALTSPRRIVTLGGLFVHHAHALERGMPTRAFYSNHGQSDKESSQRAIEAASVAEQEHVEAAKQDSEVNASIIQGKHPQDGEKVAVTVCVALRIQQTAPPPKTHIVSKNTSTHKPKEHTNPRRAHLQLAGV